MSSLVRKVFFLFGIKMMWLNVFDGALSAQTFEGLPFKASGFLIDGRCEACKKTITHPQKRCILMYPLYPNAWHFAQISPCVVWHAILSIAVRPTQLDQTHHAHHNVVDEESNRQVLCHAHRGHALCPSIFAPRDQIPVGETEKPRNRETEKPSPQKVLQHPQGFPRTMHKECTEEYSDRWKNVCFACTCSSNQKEKNSPCFLGTSKSFNFIRSFVTQQHPKPVFSFWQTPYLAVGNTVLQPTKFLSWFCRGKIFSSLKAAQSTFQFGSHGLKLFGLHCAARWFYPIFESKKVRK